MPETFTKLKVFVASPGDVAPERKAVDDVATELNRGIAADRGIVLEIVKWETHAWPGFGKGPQDVINQQIGVYDIFVGVMWNRLGTPTHEAASGTVEEFARAYKLWKESTRPKLLFYFNRTPFDPASLEEIDDKQRVLESKSSLRGLGGLYWEYTGVEAFRDLIRGHLTQELRQWNKATEVSPEFGGVRTERFCDPENWARLERIGPWQLNEGMVTGDGVYHYLLSEHEYGRRPFRLSSTLRFRNVAKFAGSTPDNANPGFIFGWRRTDVGTAYYNMLLTGSRMLLEAIGMDDGDAYRDFRHLDTGVVFQLAEDREYTFTLTVTPHVVDVFVDNVRLYSVSAPRGFLGKVGIRPWRSRISASFFEVAEL